MVPKMAGMIFHLFCVSFTTLNLVLCNIMVLGQ